MWGFGGVKVEARTELERLAAEIEGVFLGMPPADQQTVATTIRAMVGAGAGLRVVPDELGGAIGRIVMRVFYELNTPFARKPTPEDIAKQIAKGAARLLETLGVTPAELEQLVGGR